MSARRIAAAPRKGPRGGILHGPPGPRGSGQPWCTPPLDGLDITFTPPPTASRAHDLGNMQYSRRAEGLSRSFATRTRRGCGRGVNEAPVIRKRRTICRASAGDATAGSAYAICLLQKSAHGCETRGQRREEKLFGVCRRSPPPSSWSRRRNLDGASPIDLSGPCVSAPVTERPEDISGWRPDTRAPAGSGAVGLRVAQVLSGGALPMYISGDHSPLSEEFSALLSSLAYCRARRFLCPDGRNGEESTTRPHRRGSSSTSGEIIAGSREGDSPRQDLGWRPLL